VYYFVFFRNNKIRCVCVCVCVHLRTHLGGATKTGRPQLFATAAVAKASRIGWGPGPTTKHALGFRCGHGMRDGRASRLLREPTD